jgi:hypothetical protein
MLVDSLIEIQPAGRIGGKVVWEWHAWDHLVQDHDKTKPNYGDVAAHPELIDANFARNAGGGFFNFFGGPPKPKKAESDKSKKEETKKAAEEDKKSSEEDIEKLKGLGYIGQSGGKKFEGFFPDWLHVNGISYNEKFDQIMISVREFNEVWIIDHSTTTAEAASHKGGKYGKGGDLLYRWGNPLAYRAGTAQDQRLFQQHDTHWIPKGLPGEGHMLVFNNGGGRPDGRYSSVDEVVLPVDASGNYPREPGKPFGPTEAEWSFTEKRKSNFFAMLMSGAQRLPNGNTLIATGFYGSIFEVTPKNEVVWNYLVPSDLPQGMGPFMFLAGPGNPIFRAYRYGKDHPGLANRDLTPGELISIVVENDKEKEE